MEAPSRAEFYMSNCPEPPLSIERLTEHLPIFLCTWFQFYNFTLSQTKESMSFFSLCCSFVYSFL